MDFSLVFSSTQQPREQDPYLPKGETKVVIRCYGKSRGPLCQTTEEDIATSIDRRNHH